MGIAVHQRDQRWVYKVANLAIWVQTRLILSKRRKSHWASPKYVHESLQTVDWRQKLHPSQKLKSLIRTSKDWTISKRRKKEDCQEINWE